MQLNIKFEGAKFFKVILWFLVAAAVANGLFFCYRFIFAHKNPLPSSIKQQLRFPAIYPDGDLAAKVNPNSLNYQASQKTLIYSVNNNGDDITVTESSAGGLAGPNLTYYQSLGLHPVAEIQTKLGLAVLINFYTAGSLGAFGQNGVLVDGGTLLVAHPAKSMGTEAWETFLNNLQLYNK